MKKYFYTFCVFASFLISCSSDEGSLQPEEFSVSISSDVNSATIDEVIPITITSNKSLTYIGDVNYNGEDYFITNYNGNISGLSGTVYVQFHTAGNHSVQVFGRDETSEVISNTLNFTISQGNPIQIKEITLNRLDVADNNLDPDENGVSQRPDVFLTFQKYKISPLNSNLYIRYEKDWKVTTVDENAQTLTWNVSNDDYYLQSEVPFLFQVFDKDEGSSTHISSLREEYIVDFSEFETTRPTTIIKTFSDMEIEFLVDWN